jgi:hypothetical protein
MQYRPSEPICQSASGRRPERPLSYALSTAPQSPISIAFILFDSAQIATPESAMAGVQHERSKLFVDAVGPAILFNGPIWIDCSTLQEAVMEWYRLPPERAQRSEYPSHWRPAIPRGRNCATELQQPAQRQSHMTEAYISVYGY